MQADATDNIMKSLFTPTLKTSATLKRMGASRFLELGVNLSTGLRA
jgi:hypothetical protein